MAEWVPPKINYWDTPRPVGGEDYKRIEGNLQYLKDHCLFWYEPSDEILLESLSQKTVSSESYATMKTFRLAYPGRYKIAFEARRAAEQVLYNFDYASIQVWGQSTGTLTTAWKPFTFTHLVPTVYTTFNIQGRGRQYSAGGLLPLAVYIRNVRIYGSPAPIPPPAFTLN